MDIKDYKNILDAIPKTGIYVVREDNHEILYLNQRIRELAPHVREGMTCDRMWANSCLNCPLLNIGDKPKSQSINNDNLLGTVDMEARRMLWEDHIPAFMITLTPHLDEFSNIYRKILRVNLSQDSYEVVKSGAEEWAIDSRKETFGAWLEQFKQHGVIHPDDMERFLSFTHPEYLKSVLRTGRKHLTCSYRRSSPGGYRWNLLEVTPDSGYTDRNQTVLIYIKDVQDMLKESLELDETSVRLQEVTRTLGEQNLGIYTIELNDGNVNLVREGGYSQEGWTSQTLMWDVVMQSRLIRQIHPENREQFGKKFSLEGLLSARDRGLQKLDMLCQWRVGGKYRYVAVIAYFGRNQSTRNYVVVALQDVDARVRQEQILSQRDMQMAAILKSRFHVMTTVYLENDQCERFWLNESAQPQNGGKGRYTQFYQRALESSVYPEDLDKFRKCMSPEHMRRRAEETQDYSEEICSYRLQGPREQWLEQHVTYIRSGGQVLVNILGRDITKEKLEERERLKLEQEQASIINSLSSMFFATYYGDLEQNQMRGMNQLEDVREVLGDRTDYDTALRTYAETFVHPEDRANYLYTMSSKNLRQVLKREQPFVTFAYRKMPERADSSPDDYGWIRATAVLARTDEEGRASGVVYAAQDVTESKRKEMREQRAIQAACEAANHANASKSEFLSRMSHDIRTPMNGIMGMTKIASENVQDHERVRDCLGKIAVSGSSLLSLVNEILDMSELESGNVDLVADEFKISGLIEDVVSALQPRAAEKGLELRSSHGDVEHQEVIGDKGRISQVFSNILSNSIKFTPEGGRLSLTVVERETKKYGCCFYDFVFEDNGIGMDQEFLPHIYEPFSRAEDSRISRIEGTGLGMTIAQNIVRMMGGFIKVESALGKGTRVTVTLLLKLHKGAGDTADVAQKAEETNADARFTGRRILLVEDNIINQEIAMEIIGATGAAVECASDGKKGLELFESMPEGYFDMILMDIQMPVMNGYEATRAIRKLPRRDVLSIPIIALSANAFAEDVAVGREAGMNEHMAKPLDVAQLTAAMIRWIGV
ncbi:MAG: response regulator [Lachnospiraceae bacterium]|nr:response regulator [Lachnospiraceae bacterium]